MYGSERGASVNSGFTSSAVSQLFISHGVIVLKCCLNNAAIGNAMCTEAGSCSNCGDEATPTGSPTYLPSYVPTASPENKLTRTYVPSQSPLMF
jgi:hypothetical protein